MAAVYGTHAGDTGVCGGDHHLALSCAQGSRILASTEPGVVDLPNNNKH